MEAQNFSRVGIVILGAGEGKRMKCEGVPKVLVPLHEKPMISHILENLTSAPLHADPNPIIVVGFKAAVVKEALGDSYRYALQAEQLGTGHAVMQARDLAEGRYDHIVVLYGDQPYVTANVVNTLVDTHLAADATMSMMTIEVPNFEGWRAGFYNFSRVIRDEQGIIVRTVERKDATPEEMEIKELNPCIYCFRADWLWEQLPKLENQNAQKEFYLTDLLEVATKNGEPIASFVGDPIVALGANTRDELELLHAVKDEE
ncbi:MAG: NTP transferase domain-containing protein [Candidatus Magasanikbacteria bacterium]|nr:NTP transferase domain-containing protein [Candidatus Magasanikbacteria bacterium]